MMGQSKIDIMFDGFANNLSLNITLIHFFSVVMTNFECFRLHVETCLMLNGDLKLNLHVAQSSSIIGWCGLLAVLDNSCFCLCVYDKIGHSSSLAWLNFTQTKRSRSNQTLLYALIQVGYNIQNVLNTNIKSYMKISRVGSNI